MPELCAQAEPANDAIAKSKRVLALVDAYVEHPTNANRATLRSALFEEMSVVATPDHEIAHLVRRLSDMAMQPHKGNDLHERMAALVVPAIKRGSAAQRTGQDLAAHQARLRLAQELEAQADFDESESHGGAGFETRELMRRAASELLRPPAAPAPQSPSDDGRANTSADNAQASDHVIESLAAATRQLAYCLKRVGRDLDNENARKWAAQQHARALELLRHLGLAGSPLRAGESAGPHRPR